MVVLARRRVTGEVTLLSPMEGRQAALRAERGEPKASKRDALGMADRSSTCSGDPTMLGTWNTSSESPVLLEAGMSTAEADFKPRVIVWSEFPLIVADSVLVRFRPGICIMVSVWKFKALSMR